MSTVDDLVTWLRQQLDEDWMWASEASRQRDGQQPEGGAHWHWVCAGHDEVVVPQPGATEFMQCSHGDWDVSLRSVEEYPSNLPGIELPTFVIRGSEEVQPVHGEHIARWDPARVLAEVEAKRALIDYVYPTRIPALGDVAYMVILHLAQPLADRPGFRDEWRLT